MAHFRGIPTYLRERFGVPVVFYDGDVPMSLPEFGGMDTGFNYYHGADPSEYDLVVSNSEGGLERLRELGARRAEAVFWGADPEFFAPRQVEKVHDVFFYGYGDKFRRDWMAAMVGEPSRAAPELEFALGGRDFQGDTGRAWLVGDVPFNAFAQAISAGADQPEHHAALARERLRLLVARVRSSSPLPAAAIVSNPYEGIERWFEPGEELLVVHDAGEALAAYRELLDDPAQAEAMGARARERVLDEHTYAHRARQLLSLVGLGVPAGLVPERVGSRSSRPGTRRRRSAASSSELRAFDPELDVVVIDDGSVDATAEVAAAAGAEVVRLPFNLGIGGAVQTGFKYALEHGYEVVLRLDGDGQHDPQELPSLLAPLERGEADVVVGSRFADGNGDYKPPFARRAGIRWFARLVSLLTGQKLTDTTSGFQAVNARAIRLFAADYPHDYPEVEAAVMVVRHRLRILEVPVRMRGRETGESSITALRSLYYAIKVTLALFVGIFRRRVVPLEEG